ncbi:MAG: hypothetical protein ACFFD2_01570 [Promethearchaeota archaeon]
METDDKKKLEKFLESLKGTHTSKWKQIVEENKAEFNELKIKIKQKQKELADLVRKRKAITITNEQFNNQIEKIQQELYELESKILKLRLQGSK